MKVDKKSIAIGISIVLLGWYLHGLRTDIRDNRDAIDAVRADIQSAAEHQQSAIQRLDRIESGLAEARETVITVERRIEVSQGRLDSSAGLLKEGESILRQVREGNKGGD